MQWFKVAANLWCHPKWLKLSPQAKALWVTAASWCTQNDTFGAVSIEFLKNFSQISRPVLAAKELVNAGLWEVADDGYQFHDWDEHNINKTAWEHGKAATRARVKKHREKKNTTVSNAVSNGGCNAVTNAVSNTNVTPIEEEEEKEEEYITPLTPLEGGESETPATATGTDLAASEPQNQPASESEPATQTQTNDYPAAFEDFWAAYRHHGNKHQTFKAWKTTRKQGKSTRWLIEQAELYHQRFDAAGTPITYRKHGSTWLHNAGWDDQPQAPTGTFTRSQQAAALAMQAALAERDQASPPQAAALPAGSREVAW